MKIPEPKTTISSLIDEAHASRAELPRPHMGASMLGHPCDRWLWLSFRWAVQPQFPGRILRLFRRGQNEEAIIVGDLRRIGCGISYTGANQRRVDFGCHVSGSIDGIIDHGVPEAPLKRHVAEFKTHSLKSFNDLENHGVEKSKPMHWVQMQVYMHGTKIDRALYFAVCKDDDRIYTERVRYDKAAAEQAVERGQRIATDDHMPPPLSTDPSWYQCKFCDGYSFCHETQTTKHVNCRTCAHSTAKEDSTWRCERYSADDIPVHFQRDGCEAHVLHPDLVPWKRVASPGPWEATYIIDGVEVRNGEGDAYCYNSKELLANPKLCASGDEFSERIRATFGARIVG